MRFRYLVISILCIFTVFSESSCTRTPDKIENLRNGDVAVIGHGGPGRQSIFTYTPLDTYDGYIKALAMDAIDGVEMDVQLSADSTLVLYHDKFLESRTDAEGLIITKTAEKLAKYHYPKAWYNFDKGGQSIPQLLDILTMLKEKMPEGTFVLDLKLYPGNMDKEIYMALYADAVVGTVHATETDSNVTIESTDIHMLKLLKERDPDLHYFLYTGSMETGIPLAVEYALYGITIKYENTTALWVRRAHENGLRVAVWGERNNRQNTASLQLHPDYIQTDKIRDLIKKTNKYTSNGEE
ncbi:MAG: glycerophosphodiester phosphodiesterase family protein [Chitinophagales bacterium]